MTCSGMKIFKHTRNIPNIPQCQPVCQKGSIEYVLVSLGEEYRVRVRVRVKVRVTVRVTVRLG